jgi:hypothetical protein
VGLHVRYVVCTNGNEDRIYPSAGLEEGRGAPHRVPMMSPEYYTSAEPESEERTRAAQREELNLHASPSPLLHCSPLPSAPPTRSIAPRPSSAASPSAPQAAAEIGPARSRPPSRYAPLAEIPRPGAIDLLSHRLLAGSDTPGAREMGGGDE